jgi:hypothetical protein
MKITVPGFVTEENAQEAMKRLATKNVTDPRIVAGVATALGLGQYLGGDAAGTLPDTAALGELGEIEPSALLPSLTPEQWKFIEDNAASRGIDPSELKKGFSKLAPRIMKLIAEHPKKEITLPDTPVSR